MCKTSNEFIFLREREEKLRCLQETLRFLAEKSPPLSLRHTYGVTLMPHPLAKESELVPVPTTATGAGVSLYGRLSYFSGKSRDNCPVPKRI